MKDIKNVFFFLPILYENEKEPNKEELDDILNYCEQVPVCYKAHPLVYWEVENDTKYGKIKSRFISNEIFVKYRHEVILSHKKLLISKKLYLNYLKILIIIME